MLDSIHCSECSGESAVIDSRPSKTGIIRRRRQCLNCGYRWTTMEINEIDFDLLDDAITNLAEWRLKV